MDKIQEAGAERREAEEFLRELADEDEGRQEDSQESLATHEQAVDEAMRNIREFEA